MKGIVNSFSENLAHNDKIVSQFYNKLLRRVTNLERQHLLLQAERNLR